MNLIYLSPVPWASFAQRPQKFVKWFHDRTGGQVLWVEPYPTRFPKLTDFGRAGSKEAFTFKDDADWLEQALPRSLPIEPLPGSGVVNRLFWSQLLSQVARFGQEKDVILGIGKPSVLALQVLSVLPHVRSFYDAMDDFPSFYSGFSQAAMKIRERMIVERTDELMVSSSPLLERWTGIGKRVSLVPNGLDKDTIPKVMRERKRGRSKAVFGYVGTIGHWFDWEWIDALARCRPEDEIRLIGPNYLPIPDELSGNITFHPPCSHDDALKAMLSFDVGLIPFKRNSLTSSVDPIKYYEYRALQLPILSTKFGEMGFRGSEPGTFLTESKYDIEVVAKMALNFSYGEDAKAFVRRNCWEARFDASGLLGEMTKDSA